MNRIAPAFLRTSAWLLLLVLLAACSASVPPLPRLPSDAVVLAFGDSLTAGNGADDGQGYPAVLAGLIGRRVINAGVPGEVTEEGLRRLPEALETWRPQLVILCLGGNDMLRQQDATQTAANLRAMVRLMREQGIAVVLVGVPAPGISLRVPDFYWQIAEEYKLPFEGKTLSKIEGDRSLKADPIHPNTAGYRLLAQRLAQLLKRAGAI